MARPRIHDEATGELLLDSALHLAREGGIEAVSVRAVAEASGRSFRAVYALFGSKKALVDALAERGYQDLASKVNTIPHSENPADDLLAAGAEGFRTFALEDPELFRLTFERVSADVIAQRSVARAAAASLEALMTRIRRVRDAGQVDPGRSDMTCAFQFHSLCQGLASSELAAQPPPGPAFWPMTDGLDIEQTWRDALGCLLVGWERPPFS